MENKKQDKPQDQNSSKTTANPGKKPDSAAGLLLQASLRISDPVTGQVILKTRG